MSSKAPRPSRSFEALCLAAFCLAASLILSSCPDAVSGTPEDDNGQTDDTGAWVEAGAWPEAGYAAIDAAAGAADLSSPAGLAELASSLAERAEGLAAPDSVQLRKARAVYAWIAANIEYDGAAFQSGNIPAGSQEPAAVLASKKAVCSGYANLYRELCDGAGLACERVVGYSKGFGFAAGTTFTETNHAWNIVTVDGARFLVDATWGAGYLTTEFVFVRRVTGFWFGTDPSLALYSHLPATQSQAYELVDPPITKAQFEAKPYVASSTFSSLYDMGVDQAAMASAMASGRGLPTAYGTGGFGVRLKEAPLRRAIPKGSAAGFKASASSEKAYLLVGATWIQLASASGIFTGSATGTGEAIGLYFGPIDLNQYSCALEYAASPAARAAEARPATRIVPWNPRRAALRDPPPAARVLRVP